MRRFKTKAGKRAVYASYERLVSRWGVATEERDLETWFGTTHVVMVEVELPRFLLDRV